MKGFLKLDISIKFRALGITFGNWDDKIIWPLTGAVQLVAAIVGGVHIGEYNNHGVHIKATLVDNPLGV